MAQRNPKVKLTNEELAIVEKRTLVLRATCEAYVGKPIEELSYAHLKWLHQYFLANFNYKTDEVNYNKDDYWNTMAYSWLILDGYLDDDCDGSYALIEGMIRILLMSKDTVCRVACQAESGEGHFVSWGRINGIWYQVENRIKQPRTLKYMRDMGYEYWYYSTMEPKYIKKNKWLNAPQRVATIIYNTPKGLEADDSDFTIEKAIRVDKSKTLLKDWLATGAGITTFISGLSNHGSEVVETLQANQGNMAQFLNPQYLGAFMTILGLVGIYLRTKTSKDIDLKSDYDG